LRWDLSSGRLESHRRHHEPVGECSPAFVGMTIQEVLDTIATPGFDPQAFFDEDKNGDNRLCIKIIPNEGGPPQFNPAFVFINNKI
jgi:hypothetical protein